MSSILSSGGVGVGVGVVLATDVALSGTLIFLIPFKEKNLFPGTQLFKNQNSQPAVLRSCLSSSSNCQGGKNKEKKKKGRRVHFAEGVQKSLSSGSGDQKLTKLKLKSFGTDEIDVMGMPENRMALYKEILRNRLQRGMDGSYFDAVEFL